MMTDSPTDSDPKQLVVSAVVVADVADAAAAHDDRIMKSPSS